MKIVTKSNFVDELFIEEEVAKDLTEEYGKTIVNLLNEVYHTSHSEEYYELVEDDYIPYNGYKEVYGEI